MNIRIDLNTVNTYNERQGANPTEQELDAIRKPSGSNFLYREYCKVDFLTECIKDSSW